MPGDVLLDTNIVIALFRGDAAVEERLRAADEASVSFVTVGELHFGAYRSDRPDEERERIAAFLDGMTVLGADVGTAELYAAVRYLLRIAGRPIPENDLWIAAVALQHGRTLLTRDRHFEAVDGLSIDPCRT